MFEWPQNLEWLHQTIADADSLPLPVVLVRCFFAAITGGISAVIFAWTHRRDETFSVGFLATLVLLSILVATATQAIGTNQARAFGLVGALAIVRFRTVVEDTRDTAFVMLAVMVGMACGAGHVGLAFIALFFCAIAAVILQDRRRPLALETWSLTVRTGAGIDPAKLLQNVFDQHVGSLRLMATSTARQGAALESTWMIHFRPGMSVTGLVAELNRLEGVQNVELRRQ